MQSMLRMPTLARGQDWDPYYRYQDVTVVQQHLLANAAIAPEEGRNYRPMATQELLDALPEKRKKKPRRYRVHEPVLCPIPGEF